MPKWLKQFLAWLLALLHQPPAPLPPPSINPCQLPVDPNDPRITQLNAVLAGLANQSSGNFIGWHAFSAWRRS